MRYLAIILLVAIVLSSSAVIAQEIPTFERGVNKTLTIPCLFSDNSCPATASCNATIIDPNSQTIINGQAMDRNGAVFELNLTETDLAELGQYEFTPSCCSGANCRSKFLTFLVTPSGANMINSGQGSIMLAVLIILALLNGLLYFIGFRMENKKENMILRVLVFGFAVVMSFGMTFYGLVILSETVAQSESLIVGLTIFANIFRAIAIILLFFMFLIIFSIVLRQFKIRRGLIDPD